MASASFLSLKFNGFFKIENDLSSPFFRKIGSFQSSTEQSGLS
jgi:hypothetical protein